VRVFSTLFLIIVWTFLILVPLKVYAEDITFSCKPVVAGMPKKDGSFYVEEISEESTPILDIIPNNQFLLRSKDVYFKNNLSRKFEALVPYKDVSDIEKIKEIHEGLSSWDKFIHIENFRTYYLRYLGDDGSESLKRISINEKNTKTAILTVPMGEYPSYFTLFNCKSDSAKEPIEVEWSDDPSKKIS